jgi:two-component system, chemotaxis family, protein-glutamate methylesterase/glutaminase
MRRSTGRSGDPDGGAPLYQLILIGTSLGGLAALIMATSIEGRLYRTGASRAIVQHRHRDSDTMLARFLQGLTGLCVCEVEDKQPVEPGKVYVAPANYHLFVERGSFALSLDAPVRYSRPSIDVAMMSAADAYGHRAVGIVLTGANADGSAGLRRMADAGALAVVEDPATAEMPVMPRAAIEAVPTARVFTVERMADFLRQLPSVTSTVPGTA